MKDDKKKKPTQKKSINRTAKPAVKKTTAKKQAKTSKPSMVKKVTAKKPTAKATPKQAKKTTSKANYPKHSDKEERKVGTERPIIINGRAKAPKQSQAAQPSKAAVTQRQGRVSSITYHIRYD